MKMPIVYVVDQFKTIVERVSARLTLELQAIDPKITGVHYAHGHPLEIIQHLQQLSESDTKVYDKYPLVAVFEDIRERKGVQGGFYADVSIDLVIATGTEQNYTSEQRYTKHFKPILDRIYAVLFEEIYASGYYEMTTANDVYPHDFFRRVFWGKQGLYGVEGNIFNDRIDANEIRNLELRVKIPRC